jgi:hypothetical protein
MTDSIPMPEPAQGRLPYIHSHGRARYIRADHVWTDAEGETMGALDLGDTEVIFRSPEQVRALAAVLPGLADAMEAEIARAKAAEENRGDG